MLRDLVAAWAGRRPQRVTVRGWISKLRQRGGAGTAPRRPTAWLVERRGGPPLLTDSESTARAWHDLGERVVPLFRDIR